MPKKLLILIVTCSFAVGCTGLKEGWTDFRAYYNTFYNAEEHFKDGVSSLQERPLRSNLQQPVRIHPPPATTENESFKQAIQKSASILKRHKQSKWVDDALLLMGKSYYYLQQFSAALDRFEQVAELSTDKDIKQQAAIWKGRTLLDQNAFEEGISYLGQVVQEYPPGWSVQTIAELQTLLGEHHAMLENWGEAAGYLSTAIDKIEDKSLLARTFFLYGQILERQERYGEALFAFKQVPPLFPEMAYTYGAMLKQAENDRRQDNLDTALSTYRQLYRDDKYRNQRNRLSYEIAYTLELQEKLAEAEKRYRELNNTDSRRVNRSLRARVNYRLGRIYSQEYQNYAAAAAYFDTSATLRSSPVVNSSRETEDLADAYGRYAALKKSIEEADSLLRLGRLPQEELDVAISRIEVQKRRELLKKKEQRNENLINRPTLRGEESREDSQSGMYGFLNYRNETLVARQKTEFEMIWGNRPLVDNWRRSGAISQAADSQEKTSIEKSQKKEAYASDNRRTELNLDAIPQTASQQRRLEAERASLYYQLGNLLFLELNEPDSARIYYHKAMNAEVDSALRAQSMYALHALFRTHQQADSSRYWAKKIQRRVPDSKYVRLINNESSGTTNKPLNRDTTLRKEYQRMVAAKDSAKGKQLRALAIANSSEGLASHIHYKAIRAYIQRAKQSDTLADNGKGIPRFTMTTARWDSVRAVLAEHDSLFPNSPYLSEIRLLQKGIERAVEAQNRLPNCEEQNVTLAVSPSMEVFLQSVSVPGRMEGQSFSGKVIYSFVVDERGQVYSYTLRSPSTSTGIEEALESAFKRGFSFKPFELDSSFTKIRCTVSFPVDQLQEN